MVKFSSAQYLTYLTVERHLKEWVKGIIASTNTQAVDPEISAAQNVI